MASLDFLWLWDPRVSYLLCGPSFVHAVILKACV